jgi:hypothetical protein
MRLSLVAPALTVGLLCGWAALAKADSPPPAAPIFYCPTPAKGPAAAQPAHEVRVARGPRHGAGCPTMAARRRHGRHEPEYAEGRRHRDDGDVSASQAFIYRYERALHGLDARAADEAWAQGGPPRCPERAEHCPGAWRHDMGPPPHAYVEQERLPPQPERRAPFEHAPVPPPPAPPERHVFVEHVPVPPPPPPPPAYAWQDREGGAVQVERSEREGGWSYSEQGGRGHYEHWGDFDGRDGHMDRRWAEGRDDDGGRWDDGAERARHCPPAPEHGCGMVAEHHADHEWRGGGDGGYRVAGRDAHGFLTWPGKTPPAEVER